jgi:predicted nuclease of restriction endonuclease-like (RecB) superfamily
MKAIEPGEYKQFIIEVKEKIYKAQYEALKQVNEELIKLYWEIGELIVRRQEKHGWGKSIVENLSEDLQKEFPGTKGFSAQNLWYMKQFYIEYKDDSKLQPLVGEISWSKHLVIMSKCKNALEREFYIKMTKKYGWTKNVLIHQVEGQAYKNFLMNQTNFDKTLEAKYKNQAKLAVKDSYSFDFLEMAENYSERELELGLIVNVRKLLLEMGGDFAFMGNQYRMNIGGDEFFIDLLLYHRRLKSLIAIELKTTDFKPEYAGKMQFYLTALNEQIKLREENPSIGIIICKGKNRTIVEYALKETNTPIGVASYKIRESLPEEMKQYLPGPDEIIEMLSSLNTD